MKFMCKNRYVLFILFYSDFSNFLRDLRASVLINCLLISRQRHDHVSITVLGAANHGCFAVADFHGDIRLQDPARGGNR